MKAEDKWSAWRGFHSEALRADRDATVRADANSSALTPNVRPPTTTRHQARHRAAFLFDPVPDMLRFHLEFAMDFMSVTMEA